MNHKAASDIAGAAAMYARTVDNMSRFYRKVERAHQWKRRCKAAYTKRRKLANRRD